jgi:ATP-dependent DNA helicase DinG
MLAEEAAAILGDGGPLAAVIEGFQPRPEQQRMAAAVAQALERHETLLVEAGTGTGKTYAYLVPALLSGRRVVISTGTLNLQDQLFERDLPRVRSALRIPVRVSLLKGRANYVCRYRLNAALSQTLFPTEQGRLREMQQWAQHSEAGELQEVGTFAADDRLLPQVTSTAENCLGGHCPDFERCFVVKARRAALAADLVVVNHHMLLADFVLKDEGFGEILPGADAVIVDEAHLLPELGTRFFGLRLGSRQLQDLAQDTEAEARALRDVPDLIIACEALASTASSLASQLAREPGRQMLAQFLQRAQVAPVLEQLGTDLARLAEQLVLIAERGPGPANCAARAIDLQTRLQQLLDTDDRSLVRWIEPQGRGGAILAAPLQPAEQFRKLFATHPASWVLTSATLAEAEDFSVFAGELGLEYPVTLRLDSPFDFTSQARLYCPPGMPDPNDPAYTAQVVARAVPVIEAAGGGAFVLCTSHRALQQIAESLRARLPYPLFVQGTAARATLVEQFAQSGNGVLVGTASFWQGVDVKGQALRVVIIDRLPFASPGDPVFEARLAAIREAGGEPFRDYQLPQAILLLRQGIGRLIRDTADRGLVMICDPRLHSRGYGARILASLPSMPLVRTEQAATEWLASLQEISREPAGS